MLSKNKKLILIEALLLMTVS